MRIEIFGQPVEKDVLRLKLIQSGTTVDLVAVDEFGETIDSGYILGIRGGDVFAYAGLNSSTGLKRGPDGRVNIDKA